MTFTPLPADWEPTRAALHAHTALAGVVARAHAVPDPRWWHVSLTVTDGGLAGSPLPLPDGGSARVVVDPRSHVMRLERDRDVVDAYPLHDAANALAPRLFAALTSLGLDGTYETDRLHEGAGAVYEATHAESFWDALVVIAAALEERRATRPGDPGPVQVWPHGFDIAFEWFGSRIIESEASEQGPSPAQLNLGWYPAGEPYFYSSPWPFDPSLVAQPLPGPGEWHTEGWNGSRLLYATVVDRADGPAIFAEYADAVFERARPTLDA